MSAVFHRQAGLSAVEMMVACAVFAGILLVLGESPYGPETWGEWTEAVKSATGRKGRALFMPLRKALTGRARGPEMADFVALMQSRPRF